MHGDLYQRCSQEKLVLRGAVTQTIGDLLPKSQPDLPAICPEATGRFLLNIFACYALQFCTPYLMETNRMIGALGAALLAAERT